MSSKYVPPSKRWEKPAPKPIEINSQSEFPALSSGGRRPIFSPNRSFSELASEWNEKAEEDKQKLEYRESTIKKAIEEREREYRNIVSFNTSRPEEEVFYQKEDEQLPLVNAEDDGWAVVQRRKIMPELSLQEKEDKARLWEEINTSHDDSVWVAGQSEADWGFRDRRAIQ